MSTAVQNPMAGEDVLLTLKEAMNYLRVSRSTLYRLMWADAIKGYKVGSTWRFKRSELQACVGREITPLALPTDATPITYYQNWHKCSNPECACQAKYAQVHGYWYAYWKQNGRVVGKYVGKERPAEGEMSHFDE